MAGLHILFLNALVLISLVFVSLEGDIPAHPVLAASSNLCQPLPPASGTMVSVSTVQQLVSAVNSAVSGTTILVADGVYNLNGAYLRIAVPNLTLRSASGNREAVVLDGNYQTTEIVQIVASNVTVADLTLREAYYHPIHVMSGDASHITGTFIYNVHIIDPGEQAIKINPVVNGYYADNGVVACSHIELTDTGRPHIRNNCYTGGIDAHQARGWVIRDNRIEGFWCASGLSEHAVHLWRGCRDTTIERNVLVNNARGIGLGLVTSGTGRTYEANACSGSSGYVDDYGAIVRNNFVAASSSGLFASASGFDCGICLWNACNGQVLHNSIYTTNTLKTFSAIEWRFANTHTVVTNNLANAALRERDGASAAQGGNLTSAQASWFANPAAGDLHLLPGAVGAIDQVAAPANASTDIDADPRPIGSMSDVGADEYGIPPPAAVSNLRVTNASTAGDMLNFTLTWTPPADADLAMVRYGTSMITAASWGSAQVLAGSLPGNTVSLPGSVPYSGGTVFFAVRTWKTGVAEGSALSNPVFWPKSDNFIPFVRR